jgi:hypothetical protein
MNAAPLRSRPSWRASERAIRPELWIVAAVAVGMLLVEVWQSSRMAELCLQLDLTRSTLVQARARLEFAHARLERRTTRAELAPLAAQLGLVPADAQQVVNLPAEYLADGGSQGSSEPSAVLALAERASRALVPEATARGRAGN